MKKTIFTIVILTLLFAKTAFSQLDTTGIKLVNYSEFKRINRNYQLYKHNRFTTVNDSSIDIDLSKTKRSPYETNDFIPAYIIDEVYAIYAAVFIRYNAYADALEVKKSHNAKYFSTLAKIADIKGVINNREYRYLSFTDHNGKFKSGYMQTVFNENGIKLLLRKEVIFHKEKKAENSFANRVPPRFTPYKYYYLEKNNTITYLPTSKKKFLKKFPDKKNKLGAFIKREGIQLNKEDQFIKLVKYYNSLF